MRKILNQKTIYQIIKSLLDKKVIYLFEEMEEKYAPKKVACVRLAEPYRSDSKQLAGVHLVAKAQRQTEALMAFIQLARETKHRDGGILRLKVQQKSQRGLLRAELNGQKKHLRALRAGGQPHRWL